MRQLQLLRIQNFTISSDWIAAGPDQSFDSPFGLDHLRLMEWFFATASFPGNAESGGSRGLDDHFARDFGNNIGAEIMGRHKFGPQRGPWSDHEWQGWWGDEPPFHTPVYVLTHHERPSITLSDTSFHFVDKDAAQVLADAKVAADGRDVRLGGGVTTIREFLDADLVDTMHIVVAPIEFGTGLKLWDAPDELNDRFEHETIPSPSGVMHHIFWRK